MKKIAKIQAIKAALSGSSLGSVLLCLVCMLALLAANNLRVHASQWNDTNSAAVANPTNSNGVVTAKAPVDLNAVRKLLVAGNPPEIGPHTAPVTIVEFADFECGYCRQMNDLLEKQFLPTENGQVKVIYRYFPLPSHPWARPAAQIAACVQSQNEDVFWKLHDFIYANQSSFSAASLRPQVEEFLRKQKKFKAKQFDRCVDTNANSDLVESDIRLGSSLGVRATPTLFVNGIQLVGLQKEEQLEAVVDTALKDQNTTIQN